MAMAVQMVVEEMPTTSEETPTQEQVVLGTATDRVIRWSVAGIILPSFRSVVTFFPSYQDEQIGGVVDENLFNKLRDD